MNWKHTFWMSLALFAWACDGDEDPREVAPDAGSSEAWACDAEHDGWEACEGGAVQYCHVVDGMDPHFHAGADCALLGLECVELSEQRAACADPDSACDEGAFRCGAHGTDEENTAFNCVGGLWTIEPCGTAKVCHEEAGEAHCEAGAGEACGGHGHLHGDECHCDEGYVVDAHDSTLCVPGEPAECGGYGHLEGDTCHCDEGYIVDEHDSTLCVPAMSMECGGHGHLEGDTCHCDEGYAVDEHDPTHCELAIPFPELACMLFGDEHQHEATLADTHEGAFNEAHHGPQGEPIHITPLADGLGYLHFPVFASGEHAIFLSRGDVLDGVANREGEDVVLEGAAAVGACEAEIPQHFHVDLVKPDGVEKVPYALRFAAGGDPLTVMIIRIPDAHDHE